MIASPTYDDRTSVVSILWVLINGATLQHSQCWRFSVPLLVIQDGAGAMAGETRTTLLDKGCSNVGKEWPRRQLLCTVGGLLQKATTLAASAYLMI